MISGKNVTLKITGKGQQIVILNGVSFRIPTGRITIFLGKSGAGKTSLMKCIAQLQTDYTGTIMCDDLDIKTLSPHERVKQVGFVFQHFNLFPHMNALQNCMNPLIHVLGLSHSEAEKVAHEKLALVGMQNYHLSYPNKLSGGQQQRVAIARALCLNPKLLLFDEPTSALDPQTSKSLQNVILDLSAHGITIAIASHDMAFVKGLIDLIYFLENGAVVECYDKAVNNLEQCPKVAHFLEHI